MERSEARIVLKTTFLDQNLFLSFSLNSWFYQTNADLSLRYICYLNRMSMFSGSGPRQGYCNPIIECSPMCSTPNIADKVDSL